MAGKLMSFINKVVHITTDDGRDIQGKLVVFDRHMNVVLADVTETRILGRAKQPAAAAAPGSTSTSATTAERKLGLILLRGEHVVSLRADKPLSAEGVLPKGTGTVKKVRAEGAGANSKRPRDE